MSGTGRNPIRSKGRSLKPCAGPSRAAQPVGGWRRYAVIGPRTVTSATRVPILPKSGAKRPSPNAASNGINARCNDCRGPAAGPPATCRCGRPATHPAIFLGCRPSMSLRHGRSPMRGGRRRVCHRGSRRSSGRLGPAACTAARAVCRVRPASPAAPWPDRRLRAGTGAMSSMAAPGRQKMPGPGGVR